MGRLLKRTRIVWWLKGFPGTSGEILRLGFSGLAAGNFLNVVSVLTGHSETIAIDISHLLARLDSNLLVYSGYL